MLCILKRKEKSTLKTSTLLKKWLLMMCFAFLDPFYLMVVKIKKKKSIQQ